MVDLGAETVPVVIGIEVGSPGAILADRCPTSLPVLHESSGNEEVLMGLEFTMFHSR